MPDIDQLMIEGMNKDNEVSLQPQNSYRDANNMRLITDGGDQFSLVSVDGNSFDFSLSEFTVEAGGATVKMSPIGWTTYIEPDTNSTVVVVFSTDVSGEPGGRGEVGIVTLRNNLKGLYTPLYHLDGLRFTKTHPIVNECLALRESPTITRVYWTDNYNPPRTLNLASLSRVAPDDLDLTGATIYMCVKGVVTTNGKNYGPGQTAGQVFTPNHGTVGYGRTDIIVEYFPLALVDLSPRKKIGYIKYNNRIEGTLQCGVYQYAYRLFNTDGATTTWSPLHKPVSVPLRPPSNAADVHGYQETVGGRNEEQSVNGNHIVISNVDTSYNNIEIVAFRATDKNVVGSGTIVYNDVVRSSQVNFMHTGGENLGSLTVDQLTELLEVVEKAKTVASTFNRLFIGNIENRGELTDTFDATAATITPIIYNLPSDTTPNIRSNQNIRPLFGHPHQPIGGVGIYRLQKSGGYKVINGYIIFNGVEYGEGKDQDYFVVPGNLINRVERPIGQENARVNANIRIKRYNIFGGGAVYKDILVDSYFDYKGQATCMHMKGYMRGETYRIGFLPYDKKGNPMFVRWIGDIKMPVRSSTEHGESWEVVNRDSDAVPGTRDFDNHLKVAGLEINELDLTDIIDDIGGFSIVRAPRDKVAFGQGILYPVVVDINKDGVMTHHPVAASQLDQDAHYLQNHSDNDAEGNPIIQRALNIYCIHSPDRLFRNDFGILHNTDQIRLVEYLTDYLGTRKFGEKSGTNRHFYQKFYRTTPRSAGATPIGTTETIHDSTIIDAGKKVESYFSARPTIAFDNSSQVKDNARDDLTDVIAGGDPHVGGNKGIGMKAFVVEITSKNSPTGNGMESTKRGFGATVFDDNEKAIVNFERPKSNLYGGTSDSALAATTYLFADHIQEVDDTFKKNIVDDNGKYIVNGINVFGGDTFICITDFGRIVSDNNEEDRYSQTVVFPYEGEVNVSMRQGQHVANVGNLEHEVAEGDVSPYNPKGISFDNPIQPELFIYNNAYSHDESLVSYPALPIHFNTNNEFENRVMYSDLKTNGETRDSWRNFRVNNLRDIQAENGGIFNLRLKNGRLFYWQYRGVGYLPVQERTTIGSGLGQAVRLGIGGILDRFDERTRYWGNQNTHGMIDTPEGFVWFDFNNRSVLTMNTAMKIEEMNVVKGLRRFFQDFFPGNALKSDNPVLRQGVTGFFDPIKKEVIMVFKAQEAPLLGGSRCELGDLAGYGGKNYVCTNSHEVAVVGFGLFSIDPARSSNFSLVGPSEVTVGILTGIQKFSGFYSMYPTMGIRVEDKVWMATEGDKDAILGSKAYDIGDMITVGADTYVALQSFTTGGPDKLDTSRAITPVPTENSAYWALTSSLNGVFKHDNGDTCKFYGVVRGNSVQIVTNVGREKFKTFDTFKMIGNENMFDDAIFSNSYQNASDIGASSLYKFQNRAWKYSIPLADFARMRDRYMVTDLENNNISSGDVTTSTNSPIKIVSLNIGFRLSK